MTKANVVSFSGGRTSAYLVYLIEQMRKRGEIENVHYVFMDTGAEHPKTYEFIKRCVEHFGIELICLRGNFNQPVGQGHTYDVVPMDEIQHDMVNGPYAQMMRKYGVPTVASAWCTSRMKEETHDKYCDDVFGKGNYTTWLGMREDEPKRIKLPNKRGIRYLAEISDFEKQDVLEWWASMPFDLDIEEHLGNCVFCFKKSIGKVALACKDEPELLEKWKEAIEAASDRLNQPIEKDTGGLFSERYTQHIEKGVMYRGKNSIETIIATFKDVGRDDLRGRLRSMKTYDTGSCSESCEAFGQPDLFDHTPQPR